MFFCSSYSATKIRQSEGRKLLKSVDYKIGEERNRRRQGVATTTLDEGEDLEEEEEEIY